MSRIGRLPVTIPSGVQVDIDGRQVTVQGPKGTLRHTVADPIDVVREDGVICLLYTSPSPRDGLLSRMPSSA